MNDHTGHIPAQVEGLQDEYRRCLPSENPEGSPYRRSRLSRFAPGSQDVELAFRPRSSHHPQADLFLRDGGLPDQLKVRGIDEVHVCGIDIDICVTKCAVDLFEAGVRPVVLGQYCASYGGPTLHEAALQILRRYIGADQVR
ncbi:MAG: cysteine hydrolase family protein [Hyphomonadaceae bacterium]